MALEGGPVTRTGRYAGLDVLRFIAAFLVMSFHLGFLQWSNAYSAGAKIVQGRADFPELTQFTWFGGVGVEIFFVISGFVISYSASKAGAVKFAKGRFLRLYPAAFVCASVTSAVLWLIGAAPSLKAYAFSVMLRPFGPWVDNVYWTLGIEMAFYALVFGLLAINRFRWLEPLMLLIGSGSIAAWFLKLGGVWIGHMLTDTRYGCLILAPHGVYFALGCMLWLALEKGATKLRLAAIAVFFAGGFMPIASIWASKAQHSAQLGLTPGSAVVPCLVWAAAMALIVLAVRFDRPLGKWSQRISFLGLATYPLYLVHYRVGAVVLRSLVDLGWSKALALPATMIGMIIIASLITHFPERWLRNVAARLIDRCIDALPRTLFASRRAVAEPPS